MYNLDNVTAEKEHDCNVKDFLEAIRRRKFTLNQDKTIATTSNIEIRRYIVGNGIVRPDPEGLRALKEFPPPVCFKSLRRVRGMFAYYAKWIERCADKVRPLAKEEAFPLVGDSLNALLIAELEHVALNSLDESVPFLDECDASDVAISATLYQKTSRCFHALYTARQRVALPCVRKGGHGHDRNYQEVVTLTFKTNVYFKHRSMFCRFYA